RGAGARHARARARAVRARHRRCCSDGARERSRRGARSAPAPPEPAGPLASLMRIGTRASALALAQAATVAQRIPGAELVPISSRAEADPSADKSRFVAGLEHALRSGEVDAAVHSAKDVPGELAAGLELVAAPVRAGVEDVICGAGSLEDLPSGARIGTSSVRRGAPARAGRHGGARRARRGD